MNVKLWDTMPKWVYQSILPPSIEKDPEAPNSPAWASVFSFRLIFTMSFICLYLETHY